MDINWMHFTGSSPRVRGTVSRLHRWLIGRRIIPACAGNSGTGHERASPDPDHPRVCGEQHGPCMRLTVRAGSSPRVRGTAIKALHHRMPSRIIPACAGNRRITPTPTTMSADHPRVCGEQMLRFATPRMIIGSSPRVRGTAEAAFTSRHIERIIPACAGNRMKSRQSRLMTADHPRVCGEQRHL